MRKNFFRTIGLMVVIVILGFSYIFAKDLYVKANLYMPSEEGHEYKELKDKFGTNVTVFVPGSYDSNKKNKWIIYAHGSNGSSLDLLNLPNENTLLKPLLNKGFVVVAPQYRNVTNWGNQEGIEDLVASYELGLEKFNLEENPYLLLQSMGGLVGLTSVAKGELKPKAIVGIYPVTNLKFEYENPHKTIPKYIENAYGFSDPAVFTEKTKSYDPIRDHNSEVFLDIPMLFMASYDDEIVPRMQNADKFADIVNNVGGSIKIVNHDGNHGDKTAFNIKEILGFLSTQ